jgi:hypothetical protein
MTSPQVARPRTAAADGSWLMTTAAPAGGIQAIRTSPESRHSDLPAAIALVLYRTPGPESRINQILEGEAPLRVVPAAVSSPQ